MAKIAIVGAGYVGLVTGLVLRSLGHAVVLAERDRRRVEILRRGEPPFYEPDLQEELKKANVSQEFDITSSTETAADQAEYVFLCVGTPNSPHGGMNLAGLTDATRELATGLVGTESPTVVVKSTVVPGTTNQVVRPILAETLGAEEFGLCVNPEFLRQGSALDDALNPSHIVIGADEISTAGRVRDLYRDFDCPIFESDIATAEMVKLATNAFLATKVALTNELANLCQLYGVSHDEVIGAVTMDSRFNPGFLVPGVGFGGSCLPKDLEALSTDGRKKGYRAGLFEAVLAQNDLQFSKAVELLKDELGSLDGKRIAILGLAFKGGTDDIRGSRAIPIARNLLDEGAEVIGYDQFGGRGFREEVSGIVIATRIDDALADADGCIVQADSPEFSTLSAKDFVTTMRTPIVVDGRRVLRPSRMGGVRFRRIG